MSNQIARHCVLSCVLAWHFFGWVVIGAAAEPAVWDFTAEDADWHPRAKAIAVERFTTPGPEGRDISALRIHGRIEEGWNYATLKPVPLEAGRLYRLSAWVRVDRAAPGTPMPYLKCEFQSADRKAELGRGQTEAYDATRPGAWQRLIGEFRAPPATASGWVALEKGTGTPTELDVCLADVRLEPIERHGYYDRYRLAPLPPALEKVRGVHPRIYLTGERIAELRRTMETTHASIWKRVRERADRAMRTGPPAYVLHDAYSGDEQLWQRDVGDAMPALAMAYVLTGEERYLDAARQWALASCGYKTWGLGRIDGMDLAAGHQLFGLALVYDWCYRALGEAARREIRQTLENRASAMFEAVAGGQVWWRRAYLQNHLWVNGMGMAAAGLALFDESDDAVCWVGLHLEKIRRTTASLGPDGASHEGVGYWEYGTEWLLKFMEPARTLLGVDYYDHPWWRNTAAYAQYLTLPRNAWRHDHGVVDLADCPRSHWSGPDYQLRALARECRDGRAQWLAEQVDAAGVAAGGASWLNLIWFDPAVPSRPPRDLPTLRHFQDMGIVSARSDWSGDESLLVFKCGPFLGREAVARYDYDPGGGHVHPDANHFVLFGCGEWLIRDDGYHPKWTGQHNTLLVFDRGQLGEGAMWFAGNLPLARKAMPKIVQAVSTPTLDCIGGDAAEAYPPELGLRRFVRRLIYMKPDVLIVADDVQLDRSAPLELRFHPEQMPERDGRAFLCKGKKAVLRVEPLGPENVEISGEVMSLPAREGGKESTIPTIRLTAERAEWRNASAFSWAPADQKPAIVTLRTEADRWEFSCGKRKAALDWTTSRISEAAEQD